MLDRSLAALALIAISLGLAPNALGQTIFSNNTALNVVDGSSTPVSSNIVVSGMVGTLTAVAVTLPGLAFTAQPDLDLLLVGPGGQKLIILSDVGAGSASIGSLTLSDAAANPLPVGSTVMSSGIYRPTNAATSADLFAAPAPGGPYNSPAPLAAATFASVFGGLVANGTWTLYAVDDQLGGGASTLMGGWQLTLTTLFGGAPTLTVIGSSLNPSFSSPPDNVVQFTATVTSSGVPVTTGTVTLYDGPTLLAGPTAPNGSGQVSFSTGALVQGDHLMQATYSGSATLTPSGGTLLQVVNNHAAAVPIFPQLGWR